MKKGKFIAFEGVDASGKTSVSKKIADKIIKYYNSKNIVYINKKEIEYYSGYTREHLEQLKKILWDYDDKAPLYELGDSHWMFLNLSWYSSLYECIIEKYINSGYDVIVDNWYYKMLSRFIVKKKYEKKFLEDTFCSVTEPDIVIYLDVNPAETIKRRNNFKITEVGGMDSKKMDNNNFLSYQSNVKLNMDKLAEKKKWFIIKNDCMEETEEKAIEYLYRELDL